MIVSDDSSSDSDDSLDIMSHYSSDLRLMKTSIATATSVALKTKKRKKSPDGYYLYYFVMNLVIQCLIVMI